MIIDKIKSGESKNIEFKRELPSKSEKYIKTLIAYANSAGGKLIIGAEDTTKEIVGVNPDEQSQIIDRITNALADSASPSQRYARIQCGLFKGTEKVFLLISANLTGLSMNRLRRPVSLC